MHDGQVITNEDLVMKRPGDGIPAIEIDKIIGKKINREIMAGHKLGYNDVVW